ncbi:hypothetical protein LSAT2_016120 [Lamellibrachia satsuma]|nr:hypothetical protein LSAT2_016120 [Lamellibrachia satsuma]
MGEDTRNARLMVALNGVGTAYFDPRPAVVKFLEKARRCGAPDWDIYGQIIGPADSPWWQVQLGGDYEVHRVEIFIRKYIINVYVSVTNTETTMYCARGLYFYASPTKVTCESGVHGSTVHITSRHLNCTFHLCEVDIYGTKYVDACWSSPCQNDGACKRTGGSYYCTCPARVIGRHCEHMDSCWSNPCQNAGTCKTTTDSYYCTCPWGFIGRYCEHFEACLSNPCENAGRCSSWNGESFRCICPASFTGPTCEKLQCSCLEKLSADRLTCVFRPLATIPLQIICKMNCRTPASSREKLGLVAKCDDCAVSSNYSFTWHVNTIINWQDDTGTGRNARTLSINANVLRANQVYVFNVIGT